MFGLFRKKKRISVVPAALPDLPAFPAPEEVEGLAHMPEFPQMPEAMEPIALPRRDVRELRRPVFLKQDMFESVINDIQSVRSRLDKSERMVARIEEVHDSQGRLLQSWNGTMKDIHDKLLFIDNILFKKGDMDE